MPKIELQIIRTHFFYENEFSTRLLIMDNIIVSKSLSHKSLSLRLNSTCKSHLECINILCHYCKYRHTHAIGEK